MVLAFWILLALAVVIVGGLIRRLVTSHTWYDFEIGQKYIIWVNSGNRYSGTAVDINAKRDRVTLLDEDPAKPRETAFQVRDISAVRVP